MDDRSSVVFHRVCTVEELTMDDLISRKAVAKKMRYRRDYVGRPSDPDCIIADEPSVPAVPLEPLCEWLAGWDIQVIPCNICKNVFQLESCPHGPFDCGDSEHLKMLIKKWMEGQHET